jgi:hypothetical protein
MNSKLLALEAKKRLQVERERENKHEKATNWVEERKRLSKRASERERRRTNEVSRSQIGRSEVASLPSRTSCTSFNTNTNFFRVNARPRKRSLFHFPHRVTLVYINTSPIQVSY